MLYRNFHELCDTHLYRVDIDVDATECMVRMQSQLDESPAGDEVGTFRTSSCPPWPMPRTYSLYTNDLEKYMSISQSHCKLKNKSKCRFYFNSRVKP